MFLSLFFALFQLNRETKSSRLAYGRVIRLGQQKKKRRSNRIGWANASRLSQQAHWGLGQASGQHSLRQSVTGEAVEAGNKGWERVVVV